MDLVIQLPHSQERGISTSKGLILEQETPQTGWCMKMMPNTLSDHSVLGYLEFPSVPQWFYGIMAALIIQISSDCTISEKGWSMSRLFLLKIQGFVFYIPEKFSSNILTLKGAQYMKGLLLPRVWIHMEHFAPQNEYRWIKMEQEVSPYLDFKASSPLTHPLANAEQTMPSPLKYLVRKHWVQQLPQAPEGLRRLE